MIQITADQIERVNLILSGVPKGAEKAMASVIRRANNTVRSEALKGITSVYAITRQNVRADTTIKVRTVSYTHLSEKVTESTFSAMPIAEYSRRSGTAMDYIAFVREYLQRGKA